MEIILAAGAAVLLAVYWAVSTSNHFRRILIKIEEADSGIEVALTKRYDTLTKLLAVCKNYAKYEVETLTAVVRLRQSMPAAEKAAASQQMDEILRRVNIIAEAYPELKTSENYINLQNAIADVEDHLQAARRVYNMNVSSYNQAIAVFPASIVAGLQHRTPWDFFAAENSKKDDVAMNFD
ncbi:LemA family protein [Sporomusa sp. KB1]|jgi:LemA protein|uniref:LemA family protein n=1 Tax=Sporomusa sp. KB1 TaxID=943346 RepID=UPI0011A2590F|nr:LemA family protein [Sporomusa sp. KB1]TWH48315.1 LemA protein [Sporomusa sp. KB1]